MANTRYTLAELLSALVVGTFESGKTVTIEVIKISTDTAEVLTSAACTPFTDDPATFYWEFSDLDTQPTAFTQFLCVMTDNSGTPVKVREIIEVAGWAEEIVECLPPADICKITMNVYEPGGIQTLDSDDLFDPGKKNFVELKTAYFANSRYFRVGKYKASYDQLTGQAFWLMPQGATVNVSVESIGIPAVEADVPAASTIDLYAWLNP